MDKTITKKIMIGDEHYPIIKDGEFNPIFSTLTNKACRCVVKMTNGSTITGTFGIVPYKDKLCLMVDPKLLGYYAKSADLRFTVEDIKSDMFTSFEIKVKK